MKKFLNEVSWARLVAVVIMIGLAVIGLISLFTGSLILGTIGFSGAGIILAILSDRE